MAEDKINTHHKRIDVGKHKGELYTRLPVGYLQWMVDANHDQADIAQAELDRRGTTFPDIDISGHAIDNLSLRHLKKWENREDRDQGIHSWLHDKALEALNNGKKVNDEKYKYEGITFVIKTGNKYPSVITVM